MNRRKLLSRIRVSGGSSGRLRSSDLADVFLENGQERGSDETQALLDSWSLHVGGGQFEEYDFPGVSPSILAEYRSTQQRLAGRPRVSGVDGQRSVGSGRRSPIRRLLSILGVVLSVLLLTAASAHAKPREWVTICRHIVQPRESVYSIARAYGVSPSAIATHNGLSKPNLIYTGQVLAIPDVYASLPSGPTSARQCSPETPVSPCTAYHTVARGKNLYRISLRYGVSMWRIAERNDIFNLNLITTGDVLCIP